MSAVAIGVLGLLALGARSANADKCTGRVIRALGKKERGLIACRAKKALGAVVEPKCDNRASSRFNAAYAKAGTCGPGANVCEPIADNCRDRIAAALPDLNRCEAIRLGAAGKKAAAKLACYAKAATKNIPVDDSPSGCLAKATAKFSATFNKMSGCTGDGAGTSIESLIDSECVDAALTVDGMGAVTGLCPTTTTTTTTTQASTTTTTAQASTTTTTTATTTTTTAPTCGSPSQSCHDVCTAGPAQCDACSDPCVAAVCTEDPTCCDPVGSGWDPLCVSEVDTFCCPSGGTCCGS